MRSTLLISLLLVTQTVTAKTPLQTPPTATKPKQVLLLQTDSKTQPEFFIRNLYPCPLEIAIDWSKHDNVTANPELPHRFVVASGDSPPLFKVTPNQTTKNGQFSLNYRYIFGRPLTVESTEGIRPLQLLTEPYVNLSIHTALVIQLPNSRLANVQTMSDIADIAPATIGWLAIYGALAI